MVFLLLIIIILTLCASSSHEEYSIKRFDQYERSETLEQEDHRDILKDTKTIFLPEMIIFLKKHHTHHQNKGKKIRNRNDEDDDGSKKKSCNKEDENLQLLNNNTSMKNNSAQVKSNNNNILVVKVNITEFKNMINQKIMQCNTKNNNNQQDEEQKIFWDNDMNKEEIRKLQSKIMKKYMNPTINPCDDFYGYACGNWKKYFKIPPDRSSYDTFEIIRENLDSVLNKLLKENSNMLNDENDNSLIDDDDLRVPNITALFRTTTTNHNIIIKNNTLDARKKAKLFYQSCMNEEIITKRSGQPLLATINLLGGWPLLLLSDLDWSSLNNYDLFNLLGKLRLLNNDVLISQWIGPDMKNANQYIVHIDQTSLGLPSREYFLDPKFIKYIRAYKILIIGTAKLLGGNPENIEKDVDDLVEFETGLAEIMASSEERRNISDIYLKTDLSSMTLYFPQYDWESYFNIVLGKTVSLRTPVAVYCVKYLLELVYLLSNTDTKIIKNYLIWRFVRHRLNNLDSRFLDLKQRFNFVLYGREKQPKRWQFCVTQVNTHMGMAIGAMFVQKYFDKSSRKDTIEMTQALMRSFKTILKKSTWIDEHTKRYARMKLDNIDLKIGFPDFILNATELSQRYYDIDIHPEYFFENVLNILRHLSRSEQKRLGSEVNRTLWSTSPAVVNAYYSRNKNQIMFPAGILQPPFYHKYFPKAMNFGGIGVVIGHEITHGFDDKGRLFDQQGNLMMWWRESSIRNFYERAQCIIDQYSQYVLPQLKIPIDGYLTQGENIADNGGLKESFQAYQDWICKNPSDDETLPGLNLTGKQLFFLNFAQVWCGQQKLEEAKNRMKTSVHSPGIFRIIGVLSNSEDFAREFNCPVNSIMNPDKKCTVW